MHAWPLATQATATLLWLGRPGQLSTAPHSTAQHSMPRMPSTTLGHAASRRRPQRGFSSRWIRRDLFSFCLSEFIIGQRRLLPPTPMRMQSGQAPAQALERARRVTLRRRGMQEGLPAGPRSAGENLPELPPWAVSRSPRENGPRRTWRNKVPERQLGRGLRVQCTTLGVQLSPSPLCCFSFASRQGAAGPCFCPTHTQNSMQ